MTPGIARRLGRLETALLPRPPGPRDLTDDELEIHILDLSRRVPGDPAFSAAEQEEAAQRVAAIEAGIRHMASLQRQPTYAAHLARLAAAHPGFVPAVCCTGGIDSMPSGSGFEEYADLDRPRIMERRAALRARLDVAALIAPGAGT